jgi:hypothetical protein
MVNVRVQVKISHKVKGHPSSSTSRLVSKPKQQAQINSKRETLRQAEADRQAGAMKVRHKDRESVGRRERVTFEFTLQPWRELIGELRLSWMLQIVLRPVTGGAVIVSDDTALGRRIGE